MRILDKIITFFMGSGMDECHETLKKYNYRPEKGYIKETEHGNYIWVIVKKATYQEPKNES